VPSLQILAPDGTKRSIDLSARPVKLGRAETCDVILADDAEVSREHAEVWLDEQGRVVVVDRGSKNGTRSDEGDVFRGTKRFAYRSIRIGEHDIRILGAPTVPGSPPRVMFAPDAPRVGDTQFFPSTRGLDLNQQRLTLLIQLTERIGGVFERKQLLEQALDACCEALNFERGLIVLKTQRGDTELPITRNVQTDETGAYKISRTLINRALVHGERAIVNNPATDLRGNLTESLVRFPICSCLCVPILHRSEILGVIYGDRVTQAASYQPADVDFLAAIAQQVGTGLANLRLVQEHLKSQKVYAELDQARTIQSRLLPEAPLTAGRVELEGFNEPSSAVSGDYFDYFEMDDGRIGFIIADVTGHGLPAALLMANIQSAVRVAMTGSLDLQTLATRVNRLVCRNTAAHVFITAILGSADPRSGDVEYISAGHPAPLLLSGGKVSSPTYENALPMGIDAEEKFFVRSFRRSAGVDAALFFTDGLIEAANPAGELLGFEAVERVFAGTTDPTPAGLIRTARTCVKQHLAGAPRLDDMTLLAIRLH
jgi:phosphoserine phosphatase RsbU/P